MKVIDQDAYVYIATIETTEAEPKKTTVAIVGDFEDGIVDAMNFLKEWVIEMDNARIEHGGTQAWIHFIRDIREVEGITLLDESVVIAK